MAKEHKKKADLNTRIGKYFVAIKKGKNKKQAQEIAGFADTMHPTRIEATKTYKAIEERFKDTLLKEIAMQEIASLLARNMRQEANYGASNQAAQIALDKIEPETPASDDDIDKVMVIVR